MDSYLEMIAEQTVQFLKDLQAVKRECRQLTIYNKQLHQLQAAEKELDKSTSVCGALARDHGDRIEQDLYMEKRAVKAAAKKSTASAFLKAYEQKVGSAKDMIKKLQIEVYASACSLQEGRQEDPKPC